jgi:hypothetical protein
MAPSESEGGVFIHTKDIYDQLVALRADVQHLISGTDANNRQLDDLENRMRAIEKWKYGLTAVAAFVAATISVLGNFIPGN